MRSPVLSRRLIRLWRKSRSQAHSKDSVITFSEEHGEGHHYVGVHRLQTQELLNDQEQEKTEWSCRVQEILSVLR